MGCDALKNIGTGDGDPDTVRIKIWSEHEDTEHVVYDNGPPEARPQSQSPTATHTAASIATKGVIRMGVHDPKTIVERYYEELGNQRQLAVADEIIAPHFKLFPDSSPPYGPEGVKQFVTWLCIEGFPDLTLTIEQLIAEDDTVAACVTLHASHTAQLGWLNEVRTSAPTGKPFDLTEFVFWRVNGGMITERQILIDKWGVAQQLDIFQSREA